MLSICKGFLKLRRGGLKQINQYVCHGCESEILERKVIVEKKLKQIDDIEYLQQRLFESLRIPKKYLEV